MQVDMRNKELEKIHEMERKTKQKKAAKSTSSLSVDIEEGPNKSHFILTLNQSRKAFSRDEMGQLVKICQMAGNKSDASSRLYNWLKRSRTDVLLDSGIRSGSNSVLGALYQLINKRYTAR